MFTLNERTEALQWFLEAQQRNALQARIEAMGQKDVCAVSRTGQVMRAPAKRAEGVKWVGVPPLEDAF